MLDGRIEDAKTVVGALICDAVARRLTPDGPCETTPFSTECAACQDGETVDGE